MGSQPGEDAAGAETVLLIGVVWLVVGSVYCALAAFRGGALVWAEPLLPVAGAVLVVARFYAFDPYYLPTLRRFSEDGGVGSAWVYGVLVGAFVVAALVAARRRIGFVIAMPFMVVCGLTLVFEEAGH
jgi:hypothetical protein